MRKKLWLVGVFVSVAIAASAAVAGAAEKAVAPTTAEGVMTAVDKRYQGNTRKQEGILTLIDKSNNKRVRRFTELTKKYGEDEKAISHVLSPPEVRGTGFLAYEWDDRKREDETWLYLPQLRKVKRMASTDKSGYFLGSDFTFWDMVGLDVADFDYVFADDANAPENKGQWVIVATPRKEIAERVIDDTNYVKVKYWVDKEKQIVAKAMYWLKEGHRIKYFTASNVEKISDIWTVRKTQMVMTQGGQILHASVFDLANIEYNVPIDDEAFTTYALERKIN